MNTDRGKAMKTRFFAIILTVILVLSALSPVAADFDDFQGDVDFGGAPEDGGLQETPTEDDFEYRVENGGATITKYTGSATKLTIPDTLGGYPVEGIGIRAFYRCGTLTDVIIPSGVEIIKEHAFDSCEALETVSIPDSVEKIKDAPFPYCSSLRSIEVGSGNKFYRTDDGVLYSKDGSTLVVCPGSRKEFRIPDGVITIGYGAFCSSDCLTSVTIPEGVTKIAVRGFVGCSSLTSVTIPSSMSVIEDSAFDFCESLTTVYYAGSESDWNKIEVGGYNDPLSQAQIVYDYEIPEYDKEIPEEDKGADHGGGSIFGQIKIALIVGAAILVVSVAVIVTVIIVLKKKKRT